MIGVYMCDGDGCECEYDCLYVCVQLYVQWVYYVRGV